jgi:general secretion pathway protein M
MIERLPRLQRRILAIGLLLLLVVVVVRIAMVPIVSTYLGNREAIVQMQDTITRYSKLSAQLDTLRLAVEELKEADDLDRYVLAQESEALAAAALQERVKAVVTNSGGTLSSTQVLPADADKGFKRIGVSVRMGVSIDALQRVLYELENDLPYLVADDIVILARGARKRRATTEALDLLDVRFKLHAFMRDPQEPV